MTAIELPTENALIQDFLRRVANGLRALADPEKEDILAEIGSHLRDRQRLYLAAAAPHQTGGRSFESRGSIGTAAGQAVVELMRW